MKRILIILGIYGLCGIAYAQVGTWEVQIKNIGGANETGTGYFTINGNGTVSGYSLTTLTFGVPTYSGTWSTGAKGEILVMFSESLNGQNATGTFVGKFNTKSLKGKATFGNGVNINFPSAPDKFALAETLIKAPFSGAFNRGSLLSPQFSHTT